MKVTVIKVSMMEGKGYDAMKPLIFAIFDAITPKDIEMSYIDDRIETLPERIDSDVIALSVETFAALRAYDIARKYKESQAVIDAMAAHHGDYEAKTAEAVLIAAADALSAARPGARRETLDVYIKRLEQLEEIGIPLSKMTRDLHASEWNEGNGVTEYEATFSSQGVKINMLEVVKPAGYSLPVPDDLKADRITYSRKTEN